MERPVSAGELVVLVVANRAEDHGEDLVARDVAGRLEGTVLITLEHTHAIQNGNGLSVIIADALVILEGCVGTDDSQRQSHDQSQHHCE